MINKIIKKLQEKIKKYKKSREDKKKVNKLKEKAKENRPRRNIMRIKEAYNFYSGKQWEEEDKYRLGGIKDNQKLEGYEESISFALYRNKLSLNEKSEIEQKLKMLSFEY